MTGTSSDNADKAVPKRKPCLIVFRDVLRSKSNAAWVGGIAGFQIVSAIWGIIIVAVFPSITDVAITIFNVRWVHFTSLAPLLLSGVLGVATAWTRKNSLCRFYFGSMIISFICPWLLTFTWFRLHCACTSFRQCNALNSFHDIRNGDDPYVNPWPAPEGPTKFQHLQNLKFEDPPSASTSLLNIQQNSTVITPEYPKGPSTGQANKQNAVSQLQANRVNQPKLPGNVGRSVRMRKRSYQMVLSAQGDAKGKDAEEATADDDAKSARPQIDRNPFTMQVSIDETGSANRSSLLLPVNQSSQVRNDSFAEVALLHDGTPKFNQPDENSSSEDNNSSMTKAYLFRNPEQLLYASEDEACSDQQIKSDLDLLAETRKCRRTKKGCPNHVFSALMDCVQRPQCDVVKVTTYPPDVASLHVENLDHQPRSPAKSMLEDDAKNVSMLSNPHLPSSLLTGDEKLWKLTICMLMHPMRVTDWDENNQKELYTVYFERDLHVEADDVDEVKDENDPALGLLIHEQEAKTDFEWAEYMARNRDSQCVCEPKKHSCMAHSSDPYAELGKDLSYWCTINKEHAEHCKGQVKVSDVKPFPGRPNTFWSKDLCTKRGCKCKRGLGLRMSRTDDRLLENVQKMTEQDSVLIGWKCQKWFKEDQMPWCVVGFDSPCADRREHERGQTDATKFRVFSSAIPCQEETMGLVVSKAAEMCWMLRWFCLIGEFMRIFVSIPLFYIVYRFLSNHCMDDSINDDRMSFRLESDEMEEGDELIMSESEFEDSSVTEVSSSVTEKEESKEERKKRRETEVKTKKKTKQKKKREPAWDDSWSED